MSHASWAARSASAFLLGAAAAMGGIHGCGEPRPAARHAAASCTACHGSDGNPAPPRGLGGETATTARAVGAHRLHLSDTAIRRAVPCTECHVVPSTLGSPGH